MKVRETFDKWAQNGRAERMEREHGDSVSRFLQTVSFQSPFTFLDVGCGNGWVVRRIAKNGNCKKAVGVDVSAKMIMQARRKAESGNEEFYATHVESWRYRGRFDFVFSMEALYYADSVQAALGKIYRLLKPGGKFFCGTDFYADNRATAGWTKMMKLRMHLHSKKEWRRLFQDAGFEVRTRHVRDPKNAKKWRRELGTLFITGTKPE